MTTAVAGLALPDVALALSQTDEKAISATCTVTDEFPLPTTPAAVPVMVTYMTNSRRPGDDVQTKLPKDRLRSGFAPGGEFNGVWGPKSIELALVGFRTCSYTLGRSFDPDPQKPRERVPKPDADLEIFETVFLRVLRDHNTRTVKRDSREVEFRGLDLYLWWDLEGFPGFGVRPRFGRQHEASGRGGDEPPDGRPGAIWMDKNCVEERRDSCAGLFAHELGHFLGLCHCCHKAGEAPRCINGLRPEYCPGLGLRAVQAIPCGPSDGAMGKRLMSAANPHSHPTRRKLLDCEVETAREGADKVLKFGANGITNTRER
ncbi:MAG: hypothetical protein ACREM3_01310 [Candidatus Rokuibacteriota bacterium]